jgi:hypothetical protein
VQDPGLQSLAASGAAGAAGKGAGAECPRSRAAAWLAIACTVILCALHTAAMWRGVGGIAGLNNGWPIWRDDHPLYYHSALVTRAFLKTSGTTAGYDPSFMAGYPKSVVFPASSTLPELVVAAFGGKRPELAYKVYVLVAGAAVPWLIALACPLWRVPPAGAAFAVLLHLLYVWADWPINYVAFGMLPYFLAIPLALVAQGAFARFLERPGVLIWLVATLLVSLAFLVHLTSMMVIVPGAALAYALKSSRRFRGDGPAGWRTHLAVWMIPAIVLALNSFWWLPGLWLTSTKGASDFAFFHPEGVLYRLANILWSEAPIQAVLLAIGLPGLWLLVRHNAILGSALAGFAAGGLFWGYLAGGIRSLDFLQPGRQTYALYSALAIAGGLLLVELHRRLGARTGGIANLDYWLIAGALLIGARLFGYGVYESVRIRLWHGQPFLSSQPSERLRWVVDRVGRYVKPGERLLYEEGGKDLPGIRDPFDHGRFSGLLPDRTGVEVIGGPYLYAALQTNFTQFGEGKLCGHPKPELGEREWTRADFLRYAKLYRPNAILCWSPGARRFCRNNRDLVRVLEEDGPLLIGRIEGFDGAFIEGSGRVVAEYGKIRLHDLAPGLDGSVVLRYHSVPCLTTRPQVACEPVYLEDDPVPLIRLRPPPGTSEVELEMRFPFGL